MIIFIKAWYNEYEIKGGKVEKNIIKLKHAKGVQK